MRVIIGIFLSAVFLLTSGSASAERTSITKARETLRKEIRFVKFDEVSLKPGEACPEWIDKNLLGANCQRLDVVYRGVYLSGMLINHGAPTEELTIYHVGHEAGAQKLDAPRKLSPQMIGNDAPWVINQFLLANSDVLVLFMPGMGFTPSGNHFSAGTKRLYAMLAQHNVFSLLDFDGDSGASYFIAHVKGFLDRFGVRYQKISAVGRSGGGWAVTLAAAFDQRLQCSVSVFGTLPLKLRLPVDGDDRNDMGDFEQHGLSLFKKIDYLDLYALATSSRRRHSLILNEADDCCFSGRVKGKMMWEMFSEKYPDQTGFRWYEIPKRSETDHFNMDKVVMMAIRKACPGHWADR